MEISLDTIRKTPRKSGVGAGISGYYLARPVYPCAIVGMAMILLRALGVPHPP